MAAVDSVTPRSSPVVIYMYLSMYCVFLGTWLWMLQMSFYNRKYILRNIVSNSYLKIISISFFLTQHWPLETKHCRFTF